MNFLEEYKYNWKMADNQYTEERYRNSLSPKQVEKGTKQSDNINPAQNKMGVEKFKNED